MLNTFCSGAPKEHAFLVADIAGAELSPVEADWLRHPCLAGIILFKRNFISPSQLEALTASVNETNPNLFICVDQEGGRVQRLTAPYTKLPPAACWGELYQRDPDLGLAAARACAELMALEVKSAGIDFSFAPVLDLQNSHSQVIADRAFSASPTEVIALANAWIDGMHLAKMPCVGKHFPGHGTAIADSHIELPVDNRDFDTLLREDLSVFVVLGRLLDAIMPAHLLYPCFDNLPAGFSARWIDWYFAQSEFCGVIFSDDLSMGGAAEYGNYVQRAKLALAAGCDYLLVCNAPDEARRLLDNADAGVLRAQQHDRSLIARKRFWQKVNESREHTNIGLQVLQDSDRWKILSEQLERVINA